MVGDAASFEDGRGFEAGIFSMDADEQLDQGCRRHQQENTGEGHMVADIQIRTASAVKFDLKRFDWITRSQTHL